MTATLLLLPRSVPPPPLAADVMLVHFHTAVDAAVAMRATDAPAVLVTDGLDAEDLDSLAAAIRERRAPCVEVRLAPWDGETHSPVSGVSRGVISGFGSAGIGRALAFLSNQENSTT